MSGAFLAQVMIVPGTYPPLLRPRRGGQFRIGAPKGTRKRGERGGVSAKREINCSDDPRPTTSCALACCVAAKEGYSSGFSRACRPDAAFELRFSQTHARSVQHFCTRRHRARGFWRKTEVEPEFSWAPTPSAESAVRMPDPVLRRQTAAMMERKAFAESSRALPSAREKKSQARGEFSQGFDRYWKSPIAGAASIALVRALGSEGCRKHGI